MRTLFIILLAGLSATCGGHEGDPHSMPIESFTPAEAQSVGRACEDTNDDGFCDVEITLTVQWPEEWR